MKRKFDFNFNSKRVSRVSNYEQSIGFDAGSERYICVCGIVSEDGDSITIDNNGINRFEWTNEVNSLCLTGFAEIVDSTGRIGQIFSKYFCHLVFEIKKLKDGATRKDGQFDDTGSSSAVFKHAFIINNIKIVRRSKQFIVYRLYLIGIEWYGLVSSHLFSNYDVPLPNATLNSFTDSISQAIPKDYAEKIGNAVDAISTAALGILNITSKVSSFLSGMKSGNGSSEKEPIEIFEIIKSLLNSAFKNTEIYKSGQEVPGIDDASFKMSSNIYLHAAFGYNFTIFDSIKFLLNKLYYNEMKDNGSINHDVSPRLIVYDEFQNKYGIVKYGENSEFIKAVSDGTIFIGTWESLFGSQYEALTEPVEQDLDSVVKKSTADSLRSFFKRVYHYFTLDGFKKTEIKSDEIVKYASDDQYFPKGKYQSYESKMKKDQFEKFFKDIEKNSYEVHGSEWSNDFTIYFDQVTNLINKDVLVIHTKGDITHRPGMHYGILDDGVVQNEIAQDSENANETKVANKEIKGTYNVIKVQHIVKPNSKEKDCFMEKLFLSRNFVAKTDK